MKLPSGDRKLIVIFGAIVLALIMVAAFITPQQDEDIAYPSTYSPLSGGAKAAYLLLAENGYNVERWEEPPRDLPTGEDALLIIAEPRWTFGTDEKNAIQNFVARGGRVLATGSSGAALLPDGNAHFFENPPDYPRTKCAPRIPSRFTRGGEFVARSLAYWDSKNPSHMVHYTAGGKPVVVSYPFGKGEVIWWTGPTPLTNAGLKESGSVELLLNSISTDVKPRRILWDEYFHGEREGLLATIKDTPIGWVAAQAGLILVAVIVTFSRRSGPVVPLVEESRLSPLEFVETLGGLYRRAGATQVALEVSYKRFCHLLTRRLGIHPESSAAEIAAAVEQRLGYKNPEFAPTLVRAEALVKNYDLKEAEAVPLAQALNDFARDLQLIPAVPEEKN
ncbi:MAG: DUF4350 domain-containing protein [Acidobacteria bacterium]|nr:DUF4350 domain-containing protein [Acidobacteriota bacterium]